MQFPHTAYENVEGDPIFVGGGGFLGRSAVDLTLHRMHPGSSNKDIPGLSGLWPSCLLLNIFVLFCFLLPSTAAAYPQHSLGTSLLDPTITDAQ